MECCVISVANIGFLMKLKQLYLNNLSINEIKKDKTDSGPPVDGRRRECGVFGKAEASNVIGYRTKDSSLSLIDLARPIPRCVVETTSNSR